MNGKYFKNNYSLTLFTGMGDAFQCRQTGFLDYQNWRNIIFLNIFVFVING